MFAIYFIYIEVTMKIGIFEDPSMEIEELIPLLKGSVERLTQEITSLSNAFDKQWRYKNNETFDKLGESILLSLQTRMKDIGQIFSQHLSARSKVL
jgi:hypothetical protein